MSEGVELSVQMSPCRRGSGGSESRVSWTGLFLGVGALGLSPRSSQGDTDCRGEIIYVPVNRVT